MRLNLLSKKVIGIAFSLIVITALLSQPTTTAYANDPYLDSNIPTSAMTDKDIEAMNRHEIAWLLRQNQVFRDMYQLETDFQSLIDVQVKKRGEVPVLDIALGTFDTALVIAQGVQDQAAKVIGAQYGFDAQGHVTNRDAALQTVMDARYNLRDAHFRLVVAVRALHRSYADWHYKIIHH